MTKRRAQGRSPEQLPASALAWRRVDLHIHTPGSSDYQEPRVSYLDILQKAEARGLDAIAFTDHNSVAGYAAMQREIAHLEWLEGGARLSLDEARRLNEYRRLRERVLVLAGFEFTATFGFHILAIFPEETTVRKLEHILLELNVPEEKLDLGTSEVGATTDVLRAYEVIAGAGGLVIGAHVNSTHGIAMIGLGFGGQTKIAYTQDRNLHALEVTDLESTSRRATARFFNGSKPEYPRRMHCIQGSDAHRVSRDPQRPEKDLGIGDRCTELLLPETNFAAIKELFASTDFSRERPYRPSDDPFDPLTSARAEGNTIVQAFHESPGVPRAPIKALLKDIVAFANTNGGIVYVGVSADQHAPIRGVENATELMRQIRAEAARQIAPPLEPDIETLTSEGKTVLVVTVPRGTETPYALEPGYIYVRQESETTLALRDEIVQLVRAALAPATVGPDPAAALPTRLPTPWNGDSSPPATNGNGNGAAPAREGEPSVAGASAARQGNGALAAQQLTRQVSQQAAVHQASAAERDRQQERTPVPRTGVEIIASVERDGLVYHAVRDLRNRRVVRNVTRESARRLWRYAILQSEQYIVRPEDVRWDERDPRFGFWKGYRQPEGMCRYNLVYREQAGAGANGEGERLRIFYGVTEEGIDERWRAVLPPESELTEIYYDEPAAPRPLLVPEDEPPVAQNELPTTAAPTVPAASSGELATPQPGPRPASSTPVLPSAPEQLVDRMMVAPATGATAQATRNPDDSERLPTAERTAEATPPTPDQVVATPVKARRRRAPRRSKSVDAEAVVTPPLAELAQPAGEPLLTGASAAPGIGEATPGPETAMSVAPKRPARRRRAAKTSGAVAGAADEGTNAGIVAEHQQE